MIIGFTLAVLVPLFISMFNNEYNGLYFPGGVLLLIILPLFGTRYIISGNKLSLKICGFIPCGSMDIRDIVSMERSYNLLSSPACSLKRLSIISRFGDCFLISSACEHKFLYILEKMNPAIKISVSDKKAWYRIWDWDINERKNTKSRPMICNLLKPLRGKPDRLEPPPRQHPRWLTHGKLPLSPSQSWQ